MGVSGGSHERARGAAAGRRREEADLRGEQARGHHDGARVRELRGGALGPSGRGDDGVKGSGVHRTSQLVTRRGAGPRRR